MMKIGDRFILLRSFADGYSHTAGQTGVIEWIDNEYPEDGVLLNFDGWEFEQAEIKARGRPRPDQIQCRLLPWSSLVPREFIALLATSTAP
jgi:hypothetical protein